MSKVALYDTCPENRFFGRSAMIEYLVDRARDTEMPGPGILLSGGKWTGKTEILRRVFRELYLSQAEVVPVYYGCAGRGSGAGFAGDYIKEVIKQCLAFRTRDAGLVTAEVPLSSLYRLLTKARVHDLAELLERHFEAKKSGERTAELRNALGAPGFAARKSGIPVHLILDDLDRLGGAPDLRAALVSSLSSASVSFLVASSTRAVLEGNPLERAVEAVSIGGLDVESAVSMMMETARSYRVGFDTEVLSLAAEKLCGNPMYMKNIIWAAHRAGRDLMTLRDFTDVYADEITGGDTGFALRSALPVKGLCGLKLLYACSALGPEDPAPTIESLCERLGCGADEVLGELGQLSSAGLVETGLGSIRWSADRVVKDLAVYLYETAVMGAHTQEARTAIVRDTLKDGFESRGREVKGRFLEETTALIGSFNGQKVPRVLLRNQAFIARFKDGVLKASGAEGRDDEMVLPQIIGAFDSRRWERGESGPPIIIARGFGNERYDPGNEVVWLVAVKDSETPVNRGDVENFTRRSRILKTHFNAARQVRFMIGRQGFTAEARKLLENAGSLSADAAALAILRDSIEELAAGGGRKAASLAPAKEFEVVLPSSTKAELVAARAVEEITTEMGFDDRAIGEIKSALVEACINAFEHGHAGAAKVFLKFIARSDRLTIQVQNSGADFDSMPAPVPAAEGASGLPHKRGWGLELMKGLMDEVRLEKIKGGTRIVLVKYLIKKDLA